MYRFSKENHRHEILENGEWKPLTGITSILAVVSKPELIQWAVNEACRYVSKNLKRIEDLEEVLEIAKEIHKKLKTKAGDKGAKIHAEIEKIIKKAIEENNGQINKGKIKPFVDWAKRNDVRFLASELNIYSKKLYLGGIVDFVCQIDNENWIGDLKTGKKIYPEHFWQIAGYELMLEELGMFQPIKGHIILQLRGGELKEKRSVSNEDNRDAFLACLKIYRIKQKVEGNLL